MNKVTLSVAALAAIGGSVQVQAATDVTLSNDAAYADLNQRISKAILALGEENRSEYHDPVREASKATLSDIQRRVNADYEAKTLSDNYDSYVAEIEKAVGDAKKAEAPYDAKDELLSKYSEQLDQLLQSAATAMDGSYDSEYIDPFKTSYSKDKEEAEAIKTAIDEFDVTNVDGYKSVVADLENRIATLKENLAKYNAVDLTSGNAKYVANREANNKFDAAFQDAEKAYNNAIESIGNVLSTEGYAAMRQKAIGLLNAQYKVMQEAYNANALEEGKNTVEKADVQIAKLTAAKREISSIVSKYTTDHTRLEAYYAQGVKDVASLRNKLKTTTDDLNKYSDAPYNLDQKVEDVTAINTAIGNLETKINGYIANDGADYTSDKTAIEGLIGALESATADKIADAKGYENALNKIDELENSSVITDVKNLQYKDGEFTYVPSNYITTDAIDILIAGLKTTWAEKYANGQSAETEATFDGTAVSNAITDYENAAKSALSTYQAAAEKRNERQALADELAKLDADVTLDGLVPSSLGTYGSLLEDVNEEIESITTLLGEAGSLEDSDHTNKLNAAKNVTIGKTKAEIETLIAAYEDVVNEDESVTPGNKTNYYNNLNIAAAENMIKQAKESVATSTAAIDKIIVPGTGLDSDVQQKALQNTRTEIETGVNSINDGKISETETAFKADKAGYATTAIASLKDVLVQLTEYSTKIETLKTDVAAQEANFNAYKELMKLNGSEWEIKLDVAGDITNQKSAVKGSTAEAALDASQNYYLGLLDDYSTQLGNKKTEINNSYYAGTLASNKSEFNNALTDLDNKVKGVSTAYINNNTTYTTQLGYVAAVQSLWNTKYNDISENDKSNQKDSWLEALDGELQNIINLKKDINSAWAEGKSVEKEVTIVNTKVEIEQAINDIYSQYKGGYHEAILATNNENYNAFWSKYELTKAQFDNAIASLEKFSLIKNADTKSIMNSEDLINKHQEIYDYADKFRELLKKAGDEKAARDANDELFDESSFKTTAQTYATEIETKLNEYRDDVNGKAYDKHIQNIKGAVEKIVKAEYRIKDFDESVLKADYLKDAKTLVENVQKAAALSAVTTDGITVTFTADKDNIDKEFAVIIDEYVNTVADPTVGRFAQELEGKISTGLNNAANAQFNFVANNINTLYSNELNDINNKFVLVNPTVVAGNLKEHYQNTYELYVSQWNALQASYYIDNLATYVDYLNLYKAADKDNSQIWIDAKADSENNVADATAKQDVTDLLNDANRNYLIVASGIFELYGPHHPGNTISSRLNEIGDKLDEFEVKNAAVGGHVALRDETVKPYIDGDDTNASLASTFATLQKDAIVWELSTLGTEIDKVKEHYNQAIAAIPASDIEALNKMKDYETAIQGLYDSRDEIKDRWNALSEDEQLGSFERFKSSLVEFVPAIFSIGNDLIALYDKTGDVEAKAIAAVEAAKTEIEGILSTINEKIEKYPNDLSKYSVEYNDLVEAVGVVNSIYADVEGSVSFYKDNLLFDYSDILADVTTLNGKIQHEFDVCEKDAEVYQYLSNIVNNEEDGLYAQLDAAYKEVKDYTNQTSYIEDTKEQIEWFISFYANPLENRTSKLTDTDKSRYESNFERCAAEIKTFEYTAKKNQAEYLYGNFSTALSTANAAVEAITDSKDKKLDPITSSKINNELKRLTNMLSSVRTYINQATAYSDGTGRPIKDIEGNDLTEIVRIDFVKDANGYDLIESTLNQLITDAGNVETDANEKYYKVGDANHDGNIDVRDYQVVRNWILTAKTFAEIEEEKAFGGDVNSDKRFNVADLTCISNLIFDPDFVIPNAAAASARARVMGAAEDKLTLTTESEETTIFGKTVRLAVNLDNVEAFTAGQMDITLPQGMKLVGQNLSDRANGHEVLANEISNGTFRLLVSTVENNEFNGSNGALIYLDVEVGSDFNGGNISIDEVVFSDAQGKSYYLTNNGPIVPTGIDGIEAASVKERIYSVGGQMMKAVKKGINIIVGENNKTKKVVK